MNQIPEHLQYTASHEWVNQEDDLLTVGITYHAQTMLGDLVYVELPEVETILEKDQECAVVESVKAAADVYSPVSGEVVEINMQVVENPALINQDPYGSGWLFRVRPFESDQADLLSPKEYAEQVAKEAH